MILLSLVAATACQGNGSERLKVPPPQVEPVALFAGEWQWTSSTSTDTCHLGPLVQLLQGYYSIRVNGESLSLRSVCTYLSGTGTWDGTIVMFQSDRTSVSSPTCSWQIHEVDAATLDADGFSGDAILTVSAIGDCGPGFPCEVRGAFTSVRCPSTTCGVLVCAEGG